MLQQKYLIIWLRNVLKKIKSKCIYCKHRNTNPIHPTMADLTREWLDEHVFPFTHTGVDYFGPFEVKVLRRNLKRWCCFFTWLEIEWREERKKRGTPRAHPAARPFRRKQPACALRVQWLVVEFNAYSEWQIKYKLCRETEATSVHLRNQTPLSEEKQPAWALRVQWLVVGFNVHNKWNGRNRNFREREREATSVHYRQTSVCNFCLLLKPVFLPCVVEWLFASRSGVWGQCQGLSIIPTIMLPSLTGTFEYDHLQNLEISVVYHTDRSDVESIAS